MKVLRYFLDKNQTGGATALFIELWFSLGFQSHKPNQIFFFKPVQPILHIY